MCWGSVSVTARRARRSSRGLIGGGDIRTNREQLANEAYRPGRFERGLDRLLDGIELDVQRRRGRKGPFRRS